MVFFQFVHSCFKGLACGAELTAAMTVFSLQCKLATCKNTNSPLSIGHSKLRFSLFLQSFDLWAWEGERGARKKQCGKRGKAGERRGRKRSTRTLLKASSKIAHDNMEYLWGGEVTAPLFSSFVVLCDTFVSPFYSCSILAKVIPSLFTFEPHLRCTESQQERWDMPAELGCRSSLWICFHLVTSHFSFILREDVVGLLVMELVS